MRKSPLRIFACLCLTLLMLTTMNNFRTPLTASAAPVSNQVDVTRFGARGDGKTNDAPAIIRAIHAASNLPSAVLFFPPARGYAADRTLRIPPNISVEQHAPLIYTGNRYEPFLVIGEDSVPSRASYKGLSVVRQVQSAWLPEDPMKRAVGIQLINVHSSPVEIQEASRFSIGVQLVGAGRGASYNQISLGVLHSNYIGLDITNKTGRNGELGWANENLFLGGRFAVWSDVNRSHDRIGVRITSLDRDYTGNNNNVFLKPSFELNGTRAAAGAEALPILVEHGRNNSFLLIRNESNGPVAARFLHQSMDNLVTSGYGPAEADDRSLYPTNGTAEATTAFLQQYSAPLALFALADRMDTDRKAISFAGMSVLADNKGKPAETAESGFSRNDDETVTIRRGHAVGFRIDTRQVRAFVIKRAAPDEQAGRLVIKAYDARGREINGPGNRVIRTDQQNRLEWDKDRFGGAWLTTRDQAKPLLIVTDPRVAALWVGVTSGDQPAILSGIGVYAQPKDFATVTSGVYK